MQVNVGEERTDRLSLPCTRFAHEQSTFVDDSDLNPLPYQLEYTAALVSFVRSWTAELGSSRIRVNVISPGPTETPIIEVGGKGAAEASRDYFRKMIPMGRLGTADELASAAVFLASDESSFITGIDLPVDGGTVSR